jgi:hypothetical protein
MCLMEEGRTMPMGLTIGYEMYIRILTIGAKVAPIARPYLEQIATGQPRSERKQPYLH